MKNQDKNTRETHIYFVRHGETDQNKKKMIQGRHDFPLNQNGIDEAYKAGEKILKMNITFDDIYSSPLIRAYKTASIIASTLNYEKEIIINNDFIERDFGVSEGLVITDESFKGVIDDTYEGLEKSYEIQDRVYNGLMNILKNNNYSNILIVAHAHVIKALLTYLDKTRSFLDMLPNCSITTFIYKDNKLYIEK